MKRQLLPQMLKVFFETLLREDTIHLHLKTNIRQLIRDKEKEEYQPAVLSYQDESGGFVEREIKVKPRGNMRLKTCYFPPLRIKFSKKDLKAEGLKQKTKLKLVLSCEAGDNFEQMVLREYLVYKLYNLMTPNSFRVQLVHLFLEDVEGKEKPKKTFAFIIEQEDELANRMKGEIFEPNALSSSAIVKDSFDLLSVFQYVVGNTDWFVLNQHNIKLVKIPANRTILAVPFDFDFAGIVKAPYAVPNEKIPINSVSVRYFIGECREKGQFDKTIQLFKDKKTEMLALCENLPYLNKRTRDGMIKYLNDSFKILENPKKIRQEIRKGCGWKPVD